MSATAKWALLLIAFAAGQLAAAAVFEVWRR